MLLILQTAVTCYKDNAILHGNSQSKILSLKLTPWPENDLLCVASANRESVCQLLYLDASNVAQNISANYVYSNLTENIINFNLSADPAQYNLIAKQSLLSYIALIVGSLESPGSIQTIQHTQMNATNCWSDLILHYNRTKGFEFLQMDGTPLDCKIESPKIQFQYFVEEKWVPINIKGVNQPDFYFEGAAFDHSKVLHYKQTLAGLTVAKDKTNFKNFFTEFEKNRLIKTRLYVTTKDGTLDQIILAEPQYILSYQSDCYDKLEFEGYASPSQIYAFSLNSLFKDQAECDQSTAKTNNQVIVISNLFNYSSEVESNTFDDFQKRLGFVKNLESNIANYSQLQNGIMISYLTYYNEAGDIINEESAFAQLKLTCIETLQTYFQLNKLCVTMQKINSTRCSSLESIKFIQVLGLYQEDGVGRDLAFTFDMTYIFNGQKQCTSKYGTCDYAPYIQGMAKIVTKFYEKSYVNKVKPYNFIQGNNEFIFTPIILLTDFSGIFMYMGIFIGVTFVAATIGVLIYLKTYLQN